MWCSLSLKDTSLIRTELLCNMGGPIIEGDYCIYHVPDVNEIKICFIGTAVVHYDFEIVQFQLSYRCCIVAR